MNAEIQLVQNQVRELFLKQRRYLDSKPANVIADLKHECEALRNDASMMVRVAAGINQAACELIEEARAKGAQS